MRRSVYLSAPAAARAALPFLVVAFSVTVLPLSFSSAYGAAPSASTADVQARDDGYAVRISSQSSFTDSLGRINVIGTVKNAGTVPVEVTVGVNVVLIEPAKGDNGDGVGSSGDNASSRIVSELTYGRVIWPSTDSPFKLTLKAGEEPEGDAFIASVKELQVPLYDGMLVLSYGNMAVGEERKLVGTVKNAGPFDFYNVSVFASVHNINKTQLETVRSNVIPVLKAGEEQAFSAIPDPAAKAGIYYYSCAGLDADDPITTLSTGDGRFLAYDLRAVAKISGMRYENATDSIAFGVNHYNPDGGPLSIKIPQAFQNQTVAVVMDGQPYSGAEVRNDGRTIHVDFFVPKGDHEVQIQGVRNIPEFPLAGLASAVSVAAIAGLAAAARLRQAFKVP